MDTTTEPLLASDEEDQSATPPSSGRKWLTVEPSLLIYFMAFMPLVPLQQQFVLDQLKLRHNISTENNFSRCQGNTSDPMYELELKVEGEASQWMVILTAVSLAPAFFMTTALGSYSDKAGRKTALLPPLVGGILRALVSILLIQFELPLEVLILAAVLEGCSGGPATFIMGCFSSIADITTHQQRSFRIFLLEVALGVGTFISQIATGYVIRLLGYLYPFAILGGLHVLNLLYTIFLLPESKPKVAKVPFFTWAHFKKTWMLYAKDDGNRRRWKLQLSLFLLLITVMVELGGNDPIVYFIISAPLCFGSILIGYFQALLYLIRNVCGLIAVKLFIPRIGDTGLMLLSNISGIVYLMLIAFSYTSTMVFVAPVGAMLYMLLVPMVRSFTSKLVTQDELGAAFSAVGMAQTLGITLGAALFNTIYSVTLMSFKPLVFFVMAGVLLIGIVLIVVLMIRMKKEKRTLSVHVTADLD